MRTGSMDLPERASDEYCPLVEPLNLRRLRHLVTVGECGSIAAAASTLNLSASALSVSLKELERSVGVTLLIRRSGEGVSLTPEGVQLLRSARELLAAADEMQQLIDSDVSGPTASVSVGSLVTIAPFVLPRLVRAHRLRHPDVEVRMHTGAQDVLIELLAAGTIHFAVTYDLELSHRVSFEAMVPAAAHVALPADHALAGEESIRLKQIAHEPFIALDLPLSREYFLSLVLSEGVAYEPRYALADIELVRSAVGNGLGWSLVNLVPPRAAAADGSRVAYVRLRTKHPPLRIGLMTLRGRRQPASVDAACQTARDVVSELVSR
jgi:DNA-binding transcriptional LysR family regulator